jgi:hypothetical protein
MNKPAQPSPETPPRRRGWFARNWRWLVPAIVLLPILIGAGVVGQRVYRMKSSEPYQMALKRVQQDSQVIERLGHPVKDASWVPSSSSFQPGTVKGQATFVFKIAGPKERATVRTEARVIAGKWGTSVLEVTFSDGKRISLGSGADGEGDAPKFKPKSGDDTGKSASKGPADVPPPAPKLPDAPNPEIKLDLPTFDPPGKEK